MIMQRLGGGEDNFKLRLAVYLAALYALQVSKFSGSRVAHRTQADREIKKTNKT